eukprot:680609-Hanusia_phi.AAC.2
MAESARLKEEEEASYRELIELDGNGQEEKCLAESLMAQLRLVGLEVEEEKARAVLRAHDLNWDEAINAILDDT